MDDREIPRISGTLRAKCLQIPEVIWQAKGIVVMGRRIKSVVFSTDIAIIRNCNADAVLAVYPFTPQQIIIRQHIRIICYTNYITIVYSTKITNS